MNSIPLFRPIRAVFELKQTDQLDLAWPMPRGVNSSQVFKSLRGPDQERPFWPTFEGKCQSSAITGFLKIEHTLGAPWTS